jgi:prepilin-type N-terminal cleavage/methylation domain-containing protein
MTVPARHNDRPGLAHGFTLVELLIVVFVVCTVAALAVPLILRARMAANESSAIGSVRAINSGQAGYSGSAAQGAYASQLAVLSQPCPGGSLGFISPDLAQDPSTRSGFVVTLSAGAAQPGLPDCNGSATRQGYYVTAEPVAVGLTGHRAFASTSRGAIFVDPAGAAPTEAAILAGTATALQ